MTTKVKGVLEIKCCGGRDLVVVQKIGKQDPFLQFEYNAIAQRIRADNNGGQKPVWNEIVSLNIVEGHEKLGIQCYDENLRTHTLIGEIILELKKILETYTHDAWFPLTHKGTPAGEIYLEFTFYPADRSHKNFDYAKKSASSTSALENHTAKLSSTDFVAINSNMAKTQKDINVAATLLSNSASSGSLKTQSISNSALQSGLQGTRLDLSPTPNTSPLPTASPQSYFVSANNVQKPLSLVSTSNDSQSVDSPFTSKLNFNSWNQLSNQLQSEQILQSSSLASQQHSPIISVTPVSQASLHLTNGLSEYPTPLPGNPPQNISPPAKQNNEAIPPSIPVSSLNFNASSHPIELAVNESTSTGERQQHTVQMPSPKPGWDGIGVYIPENFVTPMENNGFTEGIAGMPDIYMAFQTPFSRPRSFPIVTANPSDESMGMPMPMPMHHDEWARTLDHDKPYHSAPIFPTPDHEDRYGKH